MGRAWTNLSADTQSGTGTEGGSPEGSTQRDPTQAGSTSSEGPASSEGGATPEAHSSALPSPWRTFVLLGERAESVSASVSAPPPLNVFDVKSGDRIHTHTLHSATISG